MENVATTKPQISVIIPVYNAEKTVDHCISSVIDQTLSLGSGDVELLLVDDGSTDNSLQVCQSRADGIEGIRVIHKSNGGVSTARNAGLDQARGRYVCFLDSDDQLMPDALSIALETAENHDADMVAFGYQSIFPTSDTGARQPDNHCIAKTITCTISKPPTAEQYNTIAELEESLYLFQCWGKLFRREWIGTARFNTDISYGEDTAFLFQLFQQRPHTKLTAIPDILYLYSETSTGLAAGFTLNKPHDIQWQHGIRLSFYDLDSLTDTHKTALFIRLANDVLWAIDSIKRAPRSVTQKQKIEYIDQLEFSPYTKYYHKGLKQAWAGKEVKILYRLNVRFLWKFYIRH
ncbi:glycosyltransferase family 2 protein [Bifidobacterium callimiconis]|uniref:glycosyltransferase family 2 protein n=1 Tax=Bifidobacterium callimiconis TaxID=2306973 RepID=UPI001BDC674D|nr:glycosyltransferase family 2 protein [Bifidobacterium callimiconis]MBT1177301.1 glycosyltransferase family 2 protein [Bifidobacterium callimiconis]